MKKKSHYVYIKHLWRLINLNYNGKATAKQFCPFCEKACDECLTQHISKCYKLQFKENAFVELPKPDTYMKFENYNVKPQEKQIKKSVLNFNYTKTQKAASLHSWSRRFYILLKSVFIFILGLFRLLGSLWY